MSGPVDANEESIEPPLKRKRPVISCTECHRRKQKCDRQQPCFQCDKRGKGDYCVYESPDIQPVVVDNPAIYTDSTGTGPSTNWISSQSDDIPSRPISLSNSPVHSHLGYARNPTGTLGLIDSIGACVQTTAPEPPPSDDTAYRYRTILRQLPPKEQIQKLVCFFFEDVSWQYDIVDEEMFSRQLCAWEQVPYAARNQPYSLDPTVRCFPALLFQVLAQALLFQPMPHDSGLNDLKHAPDMDLVDLATEFSDAGHQIASMFGIRETALTKVQARLQEACFQKTTGLVREAWHTLGGAIRDAQELGLHRLGTAEAPSPLGPEQAQQDRMGRKVWIVLHLWDAHMAVVLGRPMATEMDPGTVPFPGHEARDKVALGNGQPTPFDVILCGYHTAYKYLQDIHRLEPAKQNSYERVGSIHSAITSNMTHVPGWARSESPLAETDPPWLPVARETLISEAHFTLLALHRPFMFSHPGSRVEALKAALQILQSQSRLFSNTAPRSYMAFNLVFATFDAVVVVAATYIIFPSENLDYLQASLRGVRWALERLGTMKTQNRMAGSAYDVVKVLESKLWDRVSATEVMLNEGADGVAAGTMAQKVNAQLPLQVVPGRLDNIMPLKPLHDLVFQDLASNLAPTGLNGGSPGDFIEQPALGDEFWRIINDMDG